MNKLETRELIRRWIEAENHEKLMYFISLNPEGGNYTLKQKEYAIEKAKSIGVRATSRLLRLPRRTIQRWLMSKEITVKRCPDWVNDWAYWRRRRREKFMFFR
ncbi:MAG: hypothetical protein GTO17_10525 [Candidatus Aminicenantes bacterium]|nr:hypothetical protein [Candidatus Aminicenantes bacterium]